MYKLLADGIVFNKLDEQVRVVEEGNEAARNTKADAVNNDDDVSVRCAMLWPRPRTKRWNVKVQIMGLLHSWI